MVFHEPIRMYMEGLPLGINTGNGCSLWAIKSFTYMLIFIVTLIRTNFMAKFSNSHLSTVSSFYTTQGKYIETISLYDIIYMHAVTIEVVAAYHKTKKC